jgi:A/G-specific adenine glycosylase
LRKALEISRRLLAWYRRGRRDLPWRRTSDPYRIWVSEIMLQQTRAQAAIPYFERFLERFPTVEALAAAGEEEVLALWSGLGYYSRARHLLHGAQRVAAAGAFPGDYESIRALPGVGDYTAAAVASIAFGLPYAVVDGNVLRVVARMENDAAETGSARTRERFRSIAQEWMDARNPGAFNQALMELGATVCLPRNPLCPACPLESLCAARAAGTAAGLPVKLRKREPVRIEADASCCGERTRTPRAWPASGVCRRPATCRRRSSGIGWENSATASRTTGTGSRFTRRRWAARNPGLSRDGQGAVFSRQLVPDRPTSSGSNPSGWRKSR